MIGDIEKANQDESDRLSDLRARRANEDIAAHRENNRVRDIDPESMAALERGDRQRETGIYEDDQTGYIHRVIGYYEENGPSTYDAELDSELSRFSDEGNPHA